jgi:hypothetical protein
LAAAEWAWSIALKAFTQGNLNADPDLPLLVEAKREYAALSSGATAPSAR